MGNLPFERAHDTVAPANLFGPNSNHVSVVRPVGNNKQPSWGWEDDGNCKGKSWMSFGRSWGGWSRWMDRRTGRRADRRRKKHQWVKIHNTLFPLTGPSLPLLHYNEGTNMWTPLSKILKIFCFPKGRFRLFHTCRANCYFKQLTCHIMTFSKYYLQKSRAKTFIVSKLTPSVLLVAWR